MNRYRVTLTVFTADSYDAEFEAMDEDHARRFGEESAGRRYPDASEIRVDEVELLTAAPEPPTDPLAQARDIIVGLLDAADHAAMEFAALSTSNQIPDVRMRLGYADACQDLGSMVAAARAFLATKEPTT